MTLLGDSHCKFVSPPGPFHLKNPSRQFSANLTNIPLDKKNELISFWLLKIKDTATSHPSHCSERD